MSLTLDETPFVRDLSLFPAGQKPCCLHSGIYIWAEAGLGFPLNSKSWTIIIANIYWALTKCRSSTNCSKNISLPNKWALPHLQLLTEKYPKTSQLPFRKNSDYLISDSIMGFIIEWSQYYLIIYFLDFNKINLISLTSTAINWWQRFSQNQNSLLYKTHYVSSERESIIWLKSTQFGIQLLIQFNLCFQCQHPLLLTCDSNQVINLYVKWLIIWDGYLFFRMTIHIKSFLRFYIHINWASLVTFDLMMDLQQAEEPEIKLPTSIGSSKKQKSSRKTSTSALLTMPKPLTVWLTMNCGKLFRR